MAKINYENLSWNIFTGAWGKRAAFSLIIILSICLVLLSYQLALLIYNKTSPENSLPSNPTTVSAPLIQLTDLPSWHLMGSSLIKTGMSENVPKTSLNLLLVGILHATLPEYSQVIISSGESDAKVYKMGEEIEPGIKVQEILKDSVIINREGRLEKIELPKESLQFSNPPQEMNTNQ